MSARSPGGGRGGGRGRRIPCSLWGELSLPILRDRGTALGPSPPVCLSPAVPGTAERQLGLAAHNSVILGPRRVPAPDSGPGSPGTRGIRLLDPGSGTGPAFTLNPRSEGPRHPGRTRLDSSASCLTEASVGTMTGPHWGLPRALLMVFISRHVLLSCAGCTQTCRPPASASPSAGVTRVHHPSLGAARVGG